MLFYRGPDERTAPQVPGLWWVATRGRGGSYKLVAGCYRLLLVTADEEFRRSFEGAFGDSLPFTAAASADEAAGHLDARFYSHVLADDDLPGRGGVGVLRHVLGLAHGRATSRMLISAHELPDAYDLFAEQVVNHHFLKPFAPDMFAEILHPWVRREASPG